MDDHLIERMREILLARDDQRRSVFGARVLFARRGLAPIPLATENISIISESSSPICSSFVDGGIGDVFITPSMCVHLVRIHSSLWSGTKRMRMHTQEAFLIVMPRAVDDDVTYEVFVYPRKSFLLPTTPQSFPAMHRGTQIPIGAIGNKVRVILEALECKRLCNELDAGDVIVRDGLVHSIDEREQLAFDRAAELARAHKVSLVGFAKTSNLYTDTGDDALRCVSRLAERIDLPWFYHPLAKRATLDITDTSIIKLHAKSRHVFRLDLLLHGGRSLAQIAAMLVTQSCDAAFLGYPYPLVFADRLARVSNQETQALRCKLLAACKTQGKILDLDLTSLDAHLILDSIG